MKDEIREIVYKNIDGRIETDEKIGDFVYPTRAMKEAIVCNIKKHISKNYIPKESVLTRGKIKKVIHNVGDIKEVPVSGDLVMCYVDDLIDALLKAGSIKVGVEDIKKWIDDITINILNDNQEYRPEHIHTEDQVGAVYLSRNSKPELSKMIAKAIYNNLKEKE